MSFLMRFSVRLVGAFLEEGQDDGVKYHFELDPPMPIGFRTAAALYGHRHGSDPAWLPPLSELLIGASTSVKSSFMAFDSEFSAKKASFPERGIIISDLVFVEKSLDSDLLRIIPILRRQALFNALMASCVPENRPFNRQFRVISSPIALEIIEADSYRGALTIVGRRLGDPEVRVEIEIGDGGEIRAEVVGDEERCDEKAAAILSRSMSIPILLHFLFSRK
jgi:hypothetical protein